MIRGYVATNKGLTDTALRIRDPVPRGLVWIDLLEPTAEESNIVETLLEIDIPTREKMQEIEVSSRLFQRAGGLFMTASILAQSETENPVATAITFILAGERLITVRYADPKSFVVFALNARHAGAAVGRADLLLVGLLDAIVDRTADVLERTGLELDAVSQIIFKDTGPLPTKSRDFQDVIRRIGGTGDLASKARESLVSILRLVTFLTQSLEAKHAPREVPARLRMIGRDVHSLTDHSTFVNNKINFLLDATLGMINIEQNSIVKIFSVAAVVFLPPTLIASVYGMNFDFMPELKWMMGYPFALLLMVVSALVPFVYFKRRGWL